MVLIVQCLCPSRHAILAMAHEVADPHAAVEDLRVAMEAVLASGSLNPWCALCGAPAASWSYEAGATQYRTLVEATPELKRLEAEQLETARALKAAGLAFDTQ